MEVIKFQAIGEDDLDIEGAVQGVGSQYIEGNSAIFTIESEETDKVLEIRVGKTPFWSFSMGPYRSQMMRNPRWNFQRGMAAGPPVTEVLEIEVPDDAIIERVG